MVSVALAIVAHCDGSPVPQSGGRFGTGNQLFDLFFLPEILKLNLIHRALGNGR